MEPLTEEQKLAALEDIRRAFRDGNLTNPIIRELVHYITHNDVTHIEPLLNILPREIYTKNIVMFENPEDVHGRLEKRISPLSIAGIYGADAVAELLIEKYNQHHARNNENIHGHLNYINHTTDMFVMHSIGSNSGYYTPLRWAIVKHDAIVYDPSANKDATALMLLQHGAEYPNLSDYEFDDVAHFRRVRPKLMLPTTVRQTDSVILYNLMIHDMLTSILDGIPFVESFEYILTNRDDYNLSLHYIFTSILSYPYTLAMMPYFTATFEAYGARKVDAYLTFLGYVTKVGDPIPYLTYMFSHGVDPNTTNKLGETILFWYTTPMRTGETVADRVNIITRLLTLTDSEGNPFGINPYIANHMGETPAARAIKRGHSQAVIDALNVRSLDRIYDLKESNPYIVDRVMNRLTKKQKRNAPNSYKKRLTAALENNETASNASIAFKPSNMPNISGRTGKNYEKYTIAQRQRMLEENPPAFNGNGGTRRRRR